MSYCILIRGPLGCGKTTVAKKITQKINGVYFSVDEILEANDLLGEEEGYISEKNFFQANDLIIKKIIPLLKKEIPIIIDGNFYFQSQIDHFIQNVNSPVHIFTLDASLQTCIDRDTKRPNSLGIDATTVVYHKTKSINPGIIIQNEGTVDECIEKILKNL